MIDWISSGISPQAVKVLDKVFVVCEKCHKARAILYNTAKQTSEHICMSCRKKKNQYTTGQIVIYKCSNCQTTKRQKYIPKRHNNWLCHHCAMKKGHNDGKYTINKIEMTPDVKAKISKKAKEQWTDKQFRESFTEQRKTTKEKRSTISKKIWSDSERLSKLSKSIKAIWQQPDYYTLKAKQSKELWEDDDYINAQIAGMSSQEVRDAIKHASKKHWDNNHDAMVAIINNNLSKPEVIAKLSQATRTNWQKPGYRLKVINGIIESLKDPQIRERIATSTSLLWQNKQYREATVSAIRASLAQPIVRNKMAIARASQPRISNIQEQLYRYLDDLKIDYYEEGPRTAIGFYAFDCLIPNTNYGKKLLIECQGDYWHSLDKAQSNDRSKFTYISKYFPDHEIMYIWEHEFATEGRVLDRLKLKLGISIEINDFSFNDVELKEPESRELKSFLDSYHYIGKDRGGKAIGAYINDLLVGAIVYSPPLRQNTAQQFGLCDGDVRELSRLCIHPSYHKRNFASWLISRSLRTLTNTKLVVAYADQTIGHSGTVYKASNFVEHHTVPPDYWYVDVDGFVMHKRTLYGKAKKMSMTEAEFAMEYNYIKVFGGNKICFIKNL